MPNYWTVCRHNDRVDRSMQQRNDFHFHLGLQVATLDALFALKELNYRRLKSATVVFFYSQQVLFQGQLHKRVKNKNIIILYHRRIEMEVPWRFASIDCKR